MLGTPPPKKKRTSQSSPSEPSDVGSVLTEVHVDFDVGEEPTRERNERVIQYQRMCAIADELFRTSKASGLDYIEFGELFADAPPELRELCMRAVRAILAPGS